MKKKIDEKIETTTEHKIENYANNINIDIPLSKINKANTESTQWGVE